MHLPVKNSTTEVSVGTIKLPADIAIPAQPMGLVLFAHGSGSSWLSSRNRMVADYLNRAGIATVLFNLLTPAEDNDQRNRFNILLLAERLKMVTEWIADQEDCKHLRVAYFGASTGAAAALVAASEMPAIAAVVSRGGRPDLAMQFLPSVKAPTLLIVGSLDTEVITLNKQALEALHCEKHMALVTGATHLFEETGKMEQVCTLAAQWFEVHFQPVALTP
ncbi:MAG TPA: dienelactone hydrolase family protein [Chitinophagaceae bacterium]|nr:dienelactone hydrolase family protein [Chitinophagaceae bacterium]